MPSATPAEIFDALHELLHIFRLRMRQRLGAVCPELSFGEMRVLMHVGQHAGCTQKALVEHSGVDKAQMARTLAGLEAKGWLVRSEGADDRRVRRLRLSAQGQRLFGRIGAERAALAAELLKDCPAARQAQLRQALLEARDSARAQSPAATR